MSRNWSLFSQRQFTLVFRKVFRMQLKMLTRSYRPPSRSRAWNLFIQRMWTKCQRSRGSDYRCLSLCSSQGRLVSFSSEPRGEGSLSVRKALNSIADPLISAKLGRVRLTLFLRSLGSSLLEAGRYLWLMVLNWFPCCLFKQFFDIWSRMQKQALLTPKGAGDSTNQLADRLQCPSLPLRWPQKYQWFLNSRKTCLLLMKNSPLFSQSTASSSAPIRTPVSLPSVRTLPPPSLPVCPNLIINYQRIVIMATRKESVFMLKPFRLQTPREIRQNCEICESRFQMLLNVQHQCKRCLRAICEKCGQNKIKIYHPEGHFSTHKCCTLCAKEEQTLIAFVERHRLTFGQKSAFADEWTKKLRKENLSSTKQGSQQRDISTQFHEKIYETNNNTIRFKSDSARILSQLCASQNYSLRQFTGLITEKVSSSLFEQKISETVIAVYAYLKAMPYSYELVYIVYFLLCFCDEVDCYFIVTRYIEKIFPQFCKLDKLRKDNLLTHELKMIIDMYKILLKKSDKEELDRVVRLLEKSFFSTCVRSLTINITPVTISFYVIDEILKNGTYISLYKVIASLVFLSRELLYQEKGELQPSVLEAFILRSVTVEQLKNTMILFQKSNMKFEMDHEFFDSNQHRKLHEKYKQLESTYHRSQQKYRNLDQKHTSLLRDYEQISNKNAALQAENVAMKEEILNNAQKFIMVEEIDKYRQENEVLKRRNNLFAEENSQLKKQMEDIKKKEMIESTERNIFDRIRKDYEKEIVDLRTKNEILEIQNQANDINFNTSFIQQKLAEKNAAIAELERQSNQLKMQLDFYRNTRSHIPPMTKEQSLFHANLSTIHKNNTLYNNNSLNLSGLHIAPKEENEKFTRFFEMGKQVADKLKGELSTCQARKAELEKEVIKLNATIVKLENNMELNEEINNFINQIPQDIRYIDSINDLEAIIAKESNHHKKGKLETILTTFRKCLYEVRYRGIDAKLKENKIKQLCQHPMTNGTSTRRSRKQSIGQSYGQRMLRQVQSIDQALQWAGKESELAQVNRSSIKKEQCMIM